MILVPFEQYKHHRMRTLVALTCPNDLIIGLMNEKLLVPSLKDGLAQRPRLFSLRTTSICNFMMHSSLKSVLKRVGKPRILTFHYLLSHL